MSISTSSGSGKWPIPTQVFYPLHSVRGLGPLVYRSQLARDFACLLDVDDSVLSWSCLSRVFTCGSKTFRPDFSVERGRGTYIIDLSSPEDQPAWLSDAVLSAGFKLEIFARDDIPAIRLKNAKDLLRYARYEVSLDDRVRLLAALDENGSLSVAECLSIFKMVSPIGGLASLILSRFITVDLDDAVIGPETTVRRHRG